MIAHEDAARAHTEIRPTVSYEEASDGNDS